MLWFSKSLFFYGLTIQKSMFINVYIWAKNENIKKRITFIDGNYPIQSFTWFIFLNFHHQIQIMRIVQSNSSQRLFSASNEQTFNGHFETNINQYEIIPCVERFIHSKQIFNKFFLIFLLFLPFSIVYLYISIYILTCMLAVFICFIVLFHFIYD